MASRIPQKHDILLEPGGLSAPAGSRIVHLFDGPGGRTRFAQFIAWGLAERDKCVIITDPPGRDLFHEALARLGVDTEKHERSGSLLIITDNLSAESIEDVGGPVLEDARMRYRFVRCVNDTSRWGERGWRPHHFLRFEVKGHLLAQDRPCTIICQYDTTVIERRHLNQIISAHQFTIVGREIEKSADRRPLSQIIFDGMDEQLRASTQLQDLTMKLTASLDLAATLDAIIEASVIICRADSAAITYLDDAGALRTVCHRGLSEDYISRRRLTRSDPALVDVMIAREPVIIEDVDDLAGVSPNYEAWKSEGIGSLVMLPLLSEGEVFGLISAGARAPRRYSQTEIDSMAILAAQASAAIVNARLVEQLRLASSTKDDFLATLSHELRTPLTPILGWMHLLKPFADDHPLLAQGLETVERNANQLSGLINDLLHLTRIVSGKIELVREPTNINALVSSAVDQVRPQAKDRHISVDVAAPVEAVISDVDPVRIQQAISNLLGNAVKFTPDGGRVSVSLSLEKGGGADASSGEIIIAVSDTGIGIAAEFLPRVFERFTQANAGINRSYGGLGLGLAIARAMVEMHGGQVTAASEGVGRGSVFTVRLPAPISESAAFENDPLKPFGEEGKVMDLGLRLVIIEDSLDTLDMLQLWLDSAGCEVLTATDAREGIRLAAEHKPDLIISDIGLPGMDGYQLIRRLRNLPGLEAVPAIALTGYAREEDLRLAIAAGYNAHIAKPAEMRRLLYLIKKLTGH